MASAAGLLSPGLVSLVRRAQQVRLEMDQNSIKGKKKKFRADLNFCAKKQRFVTVLHRENCENSNALNLREVA